MKSLLELKSKEEVRRRCTRASRLDGHGRKTYAFSSRVEAGHMPLVDFPWDADVEKITDRIRKAGKKFKLHDCFLFATRQSFHAVFPYDAISMSKYLHLLKWVGAEKPFIQQTRRRRFGSLRLGKKYSYGPKDIMLHTVIKLKEPLGLARLKGEAFMEFINGVRR